MAHKTRRLVCIHGHFYQPPREDPWTGRIERQPSAGEDHDWNARVSRECYEPNARARLYDDGQPAGEVNNYSLMSFNFGPTLIEWIEAERPELYDAILKADVESACRLSGHGNAIAQAYNHMIMPLASVRDQETQIRWGLVDFRRRFKRPAEAMWLPETACDEGVLRRLAEHGLKYVLLAPGQAQRVRPLARNGPGPWQDVAAGGLDTRRPYLWIDPADRSRAIALFFYDGALSQEIAFGHLMADSVKAAQSIESAFSDGPAPEPALASAATDGETYGHHEKFAELGLAHLIAEELPKRGLTPANFGYALSLGAPVWQAEIKSGPQGLGTSWSCAHGVGRWMTDCGCGAEAGKHLRWRQPLREALDWLRDRLAETTEREGGPLFGEVWAARDAYIDVVLDPRAKESFLDARLRRGGRRERDKALALMELQKFAMFMFTSCGWFFSDVSGLEAEQNLKYAARAVELARDSFGADYQKELLERLASAPSNNPERKDAAAVYAAVALARRAA